MPDCGRSTPACGAVAATSTYLPPSTCVFGDGYRGAHPRRGLRHGVGDGQPGPPRGRAGLELAARLRLLLLLLLSSRVRDALDMRHNTLARMQLRREARRYAKTAPSRSVAPHVAHRPHIEDAGLSHRRTLGTSAIQSTRRRAAAALVSTDGAAEAPVFAVPSVRDHASR